MPKKKKRSWEQTFNEFIETVWKEFKDLSAEDSVKFMTFITTIFLVYKTIVGTREIMDEIIDRYSIPYNYTGTGGGGAR